MKPFANHIVSIGRLVALSVFLTSAGFTTMLHHCAMSSSECCDASHADSHSQCESPMVPSPGQPSVQNGFHCHTNSIAGGLSEIQALLEKTVKPQALSLAIIAMVVLDNTSVSTVAPTYESLARHARSVVPSSVEKYILLSTFLI